MGPTLGIPDANDCHECNADGTGCAVCRNRKVGSDWLGLGRWLRLCYDCAVL